MGTLRLGGPRRVRRGAGPLEEPIGEPRRTRRGAGPRGRGTFFSWLIQLMRLTFFPWLIQSRFNLSRIIFCPRFLHSPVNRRVLICFCSMVSASCVLNSEKDLLYSLFRDRVSSCFEDRFPDLGSTPKHGRSVIFSISCEVSISWRQSVIRNTIPR